jgi:Xaa-Pro aminopeptidase
MPFGVDPRYAGGVPGLPEQGLLAQESQPEGPEPGLIDVASSALRLSSLPGASYERFVNSDPDIDTPVDYDPLDDIAGFEDKAELFIGAKTKSDVEGIKARLRQKRSDYEVLSRAGGFGTAAQITATVLDPSMLLAFAVPQVSGAKALQFRGAAQGAAEGFAVGTAYEIGMRSLQEDRGWLETALTLGGGVILGGTLGGIMGRLSSAEQSALREGIDESVINSARSEVGAASATVVSTLAEEAPAKGVKQVLDAASVIPGTKTDMQVVFESPSLRAQQTLEDLAEVPILKAKNTEEFGFRPTNADSVEARAVRTDADLANLRDAMNVAYKEYRANGGGLKLKDFEAEVAKASRREDQSVIPEVERIAKKLRADIFEPSANEARALGLLDDPVKADQNKLTEQAVEKYFKAESKQLYADYTARVLSEARKRISGERRAAIQAERAASEQTIKAGREALKKAEDAYTSAKVEITDRYARLLLDTPAAKQPRSILRQKQSELRKARTDLESARKAERSSRIAERSRLREAREQIGKKAEKDLAKSKPSRKRFERLAREGDQSDPAIKRLTELTRKRDSGLLRDIPEVPKSRLTGKELVGAKSYFRRMYDRDAIRAGRGVWLETLVKHFQRSGADELESRAAAEDVTRTIMGADVGQSNFNVRVSVPEAGPLQNRTLTIPDEEIEAFLVNDPIKVAKAYLRDMVPQINMVKKFGDKDMKGRLDEIVDDFNILREQARKTIADQDQLAAALNKLDDQQKQVTDALLRVRDRILGRATKAPTSEGGRRIVDVVRAWRSLVAAARLGSTAIVSVPQDLARISAQYGFANTVGKLAKLATSSDFRNMAKATARRAGSAVEVALSRRVQDAFDGAITEGWANTLAQSIYKYTGLNHWMDFSRTLNATLLEDRVLKVAGQLARGEKVRAFDRTRLAQLGLGEDELRGIYAQAQKHGAEIDGLRTSGSAQWDDGRIAQAYDNAILKESRQNVLQPGAANRVWWMDSELGKTIGQLKTFSLASANSYTGALAGAIGQGQYLYAARFFGFMMIGGYLGHAFRNTAAGTTVQTEPGAAAREAISQSGLLGVIPDVLSPVSRLLTRVAENTGAVDEDSALAGAFGESDRFTDRNPVSALGGPSLGAFMDAWDIAFNRVDNGLSGSDIHAIRRILPFQNVWYLRRVINWLEDEATEEITGDPAEPR